jgi:16S rRNA (cytosine1402-N4)-methyltransferase
MSYHVPALLQESIDSLNIRPDGIYADVTFGGGGHSRAILEKLANGKLIALDQDADALENSFDDKRLIVRHGNFRFLQNYLAHLGYRQIDGILADLGVSSHHFDTVERGFTFQHDALLDMRMNTNARKTAKEVVNQYPENELKRIFLEYGEIANASHVAREIAHARRNVDIERNGQLIESVKNCIPRGSENKYLAKLFQALRIEVNGELENLKALLRQSPDLLPEGGRIAVITYHSLEDRLVKNFFRTGMFEGSPQKDIYGNVSVPFRQLSNKVIIPSGKEITSNSRARSAKLRVGIRQSWKKYN